MASIFTSPWTCYLVPLVTRKWCLCSVKHVTETEKTKMTHSEGHWADGPNVNWSSLDTRPKFPGWINRKSLAMLARTDRSIVATKRLQSHSFRCKHDLCGPVFMCNVHTLQIIDQIISFFGVLETLHLGCFLSFSWWLQRGLYVELRIICVQASSFRNFISCAQQAKMEV